MSNQNNALPENTLQRIKHTIWKILDLPVRGIEDAKVKIVNEAEHLEIVIKADISKIKLDLEKIKNHDHFKSDAINSNEHTRDLFFKVPDNVKDEVEQLSKLLSNESYNEDAPVVGKNHLVNKVLDNLDNKLTNIGTPDNAQSGQVKQNLQEGANPSSCGCNCHT